MIKKNKITEKICELRNPNNESMWIVESQLEFNDIRIQIKEQKLVGYSILFEGKKYLIDSDGRLPIWPKGLFDTAGNQLKQLLYRAD